MNYSIYRISLDIHEPDSSVVLNAKRGDSNRKIYISLTDGSVPYHISKECYAVFTATKPDGKVVYNKCTIEDCVIVYKLTEQTTAVEGIVDCEIKLYGADDELITSPKFLLLVHGTVYNEGDEIESTSEFSALKKLITDAQQATDKANAAADKTIHAAKACMVIGLAAGESIALDDATDQYLIGCRVFGKTVLDAIPSPDAPVDLVSSVDGDSLTVHVAGKNLFTGWVIGGVNPTTGADYAVATQRRTDYIPISAPGQKYSISKIPNTLFNLVAFYDADKVYISRTAAGPSGGRLVEPPVNAKYFRLSIYENAEASGTIADADAMATLTMIEAGDTVTEYEAGKQLLSATVSLPNGMHGIPVIYGGNYTDANGKQWICDEVDFVRGVYVQRTKKMTLNGADSEDLTVSAIQSLPGATRFDANIATEPRAGRRFCLCNAYIGTDFANAYAESCWCNDAVTVPWLQFRICTAYASTIEELKASLQARPVEFIYALAEPIETPLSAEELAAFGLLHTHRGYTTVSNDAWADMELSYVMDAKKYIDSLIEPPSRLTEVVLRASKWTGENSLYSQVVTIADITEHSKVDLLPSVEQLAIFRNKDLAFVTENDDGVVTVYAIGDKPTNDYTMQASIMEVRV